MPKEGFKKRKKVIFNLLIKEFGLLGFIDLGLRIKKHIKRIKKEFRRPCTIAKDGWDCCRFYFYRKGTAPDTAHLNK